MRFRTGGDTTAVVVRVDPAHREHLVATALAVRSEETVENGELRLHLDFQDARHAEWALWQHAVYTEVEAPQWLRASPHRRATAIAARHAPSAGEAPPTPGRSD